MLYCCRVIRKYTVVERRCSKYCNFIYGYKIILFEKDFESLPIVPILRVFIIIQVLDYDVVGITRADFVIQ